MESNTYWKINAFSKKNKGMQATKKIKSGTVILECEPLVLACQSQVRNQFCNYCLKEKQELLKCGACGTLFYCSKECQLKDWSMHKQECKQFAVLTKQKKIGVKGDFILLVRAFLLHRSDKAIAEKFDQLLDLSDNQDLMKQVEFQFQAKILVDIFRLQKDIIPFLISLQNKISVNAFTVQDCLFSQDSKANSVYYPANFFNHSCSPNALQLYEGRTMRIIAFKEIQKDDEICINYIDDLQDQPQRNKLLKKSYLFDCQCSRCIKEKGNSIQDSDLICPGCGKEGLKGKCEKCNKEYSRVQIEQLKKRVRELKQILSNNIIPYDLAIKSFQSLKKMVKFSNPSFLKILRNLFVAAQRKADQFPEKSMKYHEDAFDFIKQVIDNFKIWFKMSSNDQFHPLLYWFYSQLGELALNIQKQKAALTYTEKAMQILKKTKFSENTPQIKEIKQRYNQILMFSQMQSNVVKRKFP